MPYRLQSTIRQLLLLVLLFCVGCTGKDSGDVGAGTPPPPPNNSLRLSPIAAGLVAPVFATAPAGDPSRLFIVQQGGLIRILKLNPLAPPTLLSSNFLDVRSLVSTDSEQGLLGMAFDPSYATNGRFYIFYTNSTGDIVVARYLRDSNNQDLANPSADATLLTVPHPNFSNHNGGMLAFGPDQCLYVGIGDGGSGGDPSNNGQNTNQRLGKILRIDPITGGACTNIATNPFASGGGAPEVWSLGLRNPWRFSFDRLNGNLYIGDVGQDMREEIDVSLAPNAGRGLNYGWRLKEGFLCFNPASNCDPGGITTAPVLDYTHDNGACAVIGGYAYRGTVQPSLAGAYFYADLCAGFVRSFVFQNGQPMQQASWPLLTPANGSITSFGEDAQGELYLMTSQGDLSKVVPN